MRRTTTAIALALLWAPSNHAFQAQNNNVRTLTPSSPSALTAVSSSVSANDDNLDWDALDRKNASRKKFGLKPMSPEEFMENESLVQQMALEQQKLAADAAIQKQQARSQPSPSTPVPGFLEKIFGDVLPDTCESNYDCEAPKVCCDFGVSKVCCAGGQRQRSFEGEMQLIPVPLGRVPPEQQY